MHVDAQLEQKRFLEPVVSSTPDRLVFGPRRHRCGVHSSLQVPRTFVALGCSEIICVLQATTCTNATTATSGETSAAPASGRHRCNHAVAVASYTSLVARAAMPPPTLCYMPYDLATPLWHALPRRAVRGQRQSDSLGPETATGAPARWCRLAVVRSRSARGLHSAVSWLAQGCLTPLALYSKVII